MNSGIEADFLNVRDWYFHDEQLHIDTERGFRIDLYLYNIEMLEIDGR